jgi:hypothetical protein
MKVVGSFNKVSEKLRKELIPQVRPNEVIRFQLLDGQYEPALGRVGFGASRSIRLNDRILDPYHTESKDEKGNVVYESAYVDIGVPDLIKEGRVERCKKHWVNSIAGGIPGNGQFELMSGSVDDMEIMEFLCLSNGNKDNKHRDPSKDPIYEKVDSKSILAKEKEYERKELQNKLKRFAKNNPEEAAEMLKALSLNGKAADS